MVEGTTEESTVSMSELKSVQLSNLKPFTRYTITVTCVNGAGPGNSSDPVTQRTNSARKLNQSAPKGLYCQTCHFLFSSSSREQCNSTDH